MNMELITPERTGKAKRVFATAKGISDADLEVVRSDIKATLREPTKGPYAQIQLRNGLTSAALLAEY